jgi:hypothetical protein
MAGSLAARATFIGSVVAWRITSVAMQPLWPLALGALCPPNVRRFIGHLGRNARPFFEAQLPRLLCGHRGS